MAGLRTSVGRHLAAVAVVLSLIGCSRPSALPASRVRFFRSEKCAICISDRNRIGTDEIRLAGAEMIAPEFEKDAIRRSEIAESGLLGASHQHRWVITHESTDDGKRAISDSCNKAGLGNALTDNLVRSRAVREFVRAEMRSGALSAGDLELALQFYGYDGETTDAMRERYARVVSIARRCPEWWDSK